MPHTWVAHQQIAGPELDELRWKCPASSSIAGFRSSWTNGDMPWRPNALAFQNWLLGHTSSGPLWSPQCISGMFTTEP